MKSEYFPAIESFEAAVRAQTRMESNPEEFTKRQCKDIVARYTAEKEYLQDWIESIGDNGGEEE